MDDNERKYDIPEVRIALMEETLRNLEAEESPDNKGFKTFDSVLVNKFVDSDSVKQENYELFDRLVVALSHENKWPRHESLKLVIQGLSALKEHIADYQDNKSTLSDRVKILINQADGLIRQDRAYNKTIDEVHYEAVKAAEDPNKFIHKDIVYSYSIYGGFEVQMQELDEEFIQEGVYPERIYSRR